MLSRHCGTARTAQMCRSKYLKVKSLFGDEVSKTVGTQTDFTCHGVCVDTQTQPALPIIRKQRTCTSFWANLKFPLKDVKMPPGVKSIHELCQSRLDEKDLSSTERAELLHAVLHNDTTTLAHSIYNIPALKLSLQNKLLFDIENNAASKCVKSKESYLYPKDYVSLRNFSFNDLFSEFVENQPFLLRCLLAVAVPTVRLGTNSIDHLQSLIPRLSFVYSSLLTARYHELSRLQRMLSVVLMDEHVHEKV